MHASEVKKPSATGPLALESLVNSTVFIHGRKDVQVDLNPLFDEGRRVLLLYPGDDARLLSEVVQDGDPRPVTLVVPDGNWGQARRAARRLPGAERAENVLLPMGLPTEWGIRLETKEGGLATFEAIARALGILEGEAVESAMMTVFRRVVHETWEMRGSKPILPPRGTEIAQQRAAKPTEADGFAEALAGPTLVDDPPPLPVLFEDESIIVINKPAGTLVHRGWGNDDLPLLQQLRDQIGQRVYPAHRLDRATSGALLFAKSSTVAARLQEQFAGRTVTKQYLALCRGHDPNLVEVDHPLAPEKGEARLPAQTKFRLIGHHDRYGLFEATPITGRVHQIRRHLKHAAHPIIGDVRYGKGEHNRIFRDHYGFHRLALHCFRLRFTHPSSGEILDVRAPLSPEFSALLARLSIEWEQPTASGQARTLAPGG